MITSLIDCWKCFDAKSHVCYRKIAQDAQTVTTHEESEEICRRRLIINEVIKQKTPSVHVR